MKKRWLDDETPLSTYDSLQEVEHIEYKSRNEKGKTNINNGASQDSGSGCCVIV